MTDSKTAREWATRIINELDMPRMMIDTRYRFVLKVLESYASYKDKRIAQLEAEVRAEESKSTALLNEFTNINDILRSAGFDASLGSTIYRVIAINEQLTSLKSSLAEKESEVYKLQHRLCGCYELASVDRPCDGLVHKEDELNSLKEENADLKQQIEVWRHHHEEHTNLEVDLAQAELASLKQENEVLRSQRLSDPLLEATLKHNNAQLAKLQLENGVMRSALERINEYCNDPSCGSVSKHALSTSTKSSLMEKVRGLIEAAELSYKYYQHPWPELASALTEVKKELGG